MVNHHYWHIPGVTDRRAQQASAERNVVCGETAILHSHTEQESCTDLCITMSPT